MSGFRINGCGVADAFRKVKSLGAHDCPVCGKFKEFHLREVKKKVYVVFIPTFTLESSYAVMCSHCDQGRFVSMEWAHTLLTGTAPKGRLYPENPAQEPLPEPAPAPEELPASETPPIAEALPEPAQKMCPHCGTACEDGHAFCGNCGARLEN